MYHPKGLVFPGTTIHIGSNHYRVIYNGLENFYKFLNGDIKISDYL
jgi:hypothetical protein